MSKKLEYNDVKEYIESQGYLLLSKEYVSFHSKLELKCPNKHKLSMNFANFKSGGWRCRKCYNDKQRWSFEEVNDYIKSQGYKLLSKEYIDNKKKLYIQCSKNHKFYAHFNGFYNMGYRCPLCANNEGKSKPEKEIADYVKTIYSGEILENDRTQVKNYWTKYNLELDIFLPDLSKAIEFNGSRWHSDDYHKWKDEMKLKQCIQKGIDLLVIDDKEWYKNENYKIYQLNRINDFIGKI